jgi:translocation and assembly module TamB
LIDTNIGRLLLDGQMTVRGTLAQPRFNGILKVVEGRIQYLDREFELEEGTLRQYEPFEINPDIDISATTQISDLTTANPIEYTISITIRGTLKDPEVTITSSPPLEEPEIVNLLTLGTSSLCASRTPRHRYRRGLASAQTRVVLAACSGVAVRALNASSASEGAGL